MSRIAGKTLPATYKKTANEFELSILVNNSGLNAPWIFSASNFAKTTPSSNEDHLYHQMNAHLFETGRKTIEQIAQACFERQREIFTKALQDPRTKLTYAVTKQYDLVEIYRYVKQLFVTRSYRGFFMELVALDSLEPYLPPGVSYWVDVDKLDVKYGIDFIIRRGKEILLAVQVKPDTFNTMKAHQNKDSDNKKNQEFTAAHGKPVHYLCYDGENNWLNMEETIALLIAQAGITEKATSDSGLSLFG